MVFYLIKFLIYNYLENDSSMNWKCAINILASSFFFCTKLMPFFKYKIVENVH